MPLVVFVLLLLFAHHTQSFPTKIIGIFNCKQCASAVAAHLAFNFTNEKALGLSYQHVPEEGLRDDTISQNGFFRNSIILTGNPHICENVSHVLPNLTSSYLVCYNTPTSKTIEIGSLAKKRVYLSQPSRHAMIPCLHSMIHKVQLLVSENGEKKSTIVLTPVIDEIYTSQKVVKALCQNIISGPSSKITVKGCLPKNHRNFTFLPTPMELADVHVVVSTLSKVPARHLLCKLHFRRCNGEKVFLVMLGPIEKDWITHQLKSNVSDNQSEPLHCTKDQLLEVAEGHILLQFQNWNLSNKNARMVRHNIIGKMNTSILGKDFHNEASLIYDSVSAVVLAFSRTLEKSGQTLKRNEMFEGELEIPFNGVSGWFSFTSDGTRNGSNATVIIHQFVNGTYIEVGKHYNANMTFYPSLGEGNSDFQDI